MGLTHCSCFKSDHALINRNVLVQDRFNLSQLNPKPPQLDLIVCPTQKLEIAIGKPAG
jgi:hypothetical protein